MKKSVIDPDELDADQLEKELARLRRGEKYRHKLLSTAGILVTIAAAAVLMATFVFPVIRITGSSMTPSFDPGQIVVGLKGGRVSPEDVIAFYCNNKMLIKRVIAGPGQWVNVRDDGSVYVDDVELEEPYVSELAAGGTDIDYPCQVPEGRYFVMGDHRADSVDSRNAAVGFVSREQIAGKIVLRVWPLHQFGSVTSHTGRAR